MALDGSKLLVIQTCAAKTLIVPGKTHGFDNMQIEAGVGAQADDIPGIWRDFWFE